MPNKDKNIPKRRFKEFGNTDAWELRKLGEVMEVTSVKRIHQSDWTDFGVRFLRARDIVAESKNESVSEPLFISQKKYDEYTAISGKVTKGDLLVTGVGTIGIPMLIEKNEPIYFKDGNIIWFKNENHIDGQFFYYSFIGKNIQSFIKESAGIGTVGTFTINTGKNTPIDLPILKKEQEDIGTFFSTLDRQITLHQRKLDKLKSVKQAYLSEMFPAEGERVPKRRFPGFTDAWELRKLGEITEKQFGGGTPTTSNALFWEGNIPWIQSSDLEEGIFSVGPRKYITKDGLGNSSAQLIPKNSIVIVTRVGVGKLAFMPFTYTTSQDFLSISYLKTNELFTTYSLYIKLQNEIKVLQGTSIKGITKNELLIKEIPIPSLPEQEAIGTFFSTLDRQITLHQRKLEKLKNLKKALLNELFV